MSDSYRREPLSSPAAGRYRVFISALIALATAGALPVFVGRTAHAGVIKISTELDGGITSVVRDGTTEYKMRVVLDSTDVPSAIITSGQYHLYVPAGLAIARAELPDTHNPPQNDSDFFFGVVMDASYNRVDSSMDGTRDLTDNVRSSEDGVSGNSNRVGDFGWYYFTVNTDAPLGQAEFGLHSVYFYDSVFNEYKSVDGNATSTCIPSDQSFLISEVPEPATLGLLGLVLPLALLRRKR